MDAIDIDRLIHDLSTQLIQPQPVAQQTPSKLDELYQMMGQQY